MQMKIKKATHKKNNEKQRKKILDILEETYRGSSTALHFSSPFELLVATILSAQTNDNQVNKITDTLFKKYHTMEEFASLTRKNWNKKLKLAVYIRIRLKISSPAQLCYLILQERFPNQRGINAVARWAGKQLMLFKQCFGIPALAVDTHVFRYRPAVSSY